MIDGGRDARGVEPCERPAIGQVRAPRRRPRRAGLDVRPVRSSPDTVARLAVQGFRAVAVRLDLYVVDTAPGSAVLAAPAGEFTNSLARVLALID